MSWLVFGGLAAGFGLLVLALPDLALALAAWALLWDLPLSLGPLTVFSSEAVLVGLAAGALIQPGWRELRRRTPAPLGWLGGAWIIWLLAHAFLPGPPWGGAKGALRAGELLLGVVLPLWLRAGRPAVAAALGAAAFAAAWASLQSLLGPAAAINAGRGIEVIHGFQAGAASLGHHNQLGAYMAAAVPLALALGWASPKSRPGVTAAAVLLCAGLAASFSRGAWIGLGLGILAAATALSWRWGLATLLSLGVLAGALIWGPATAWRERVATAASDGDRRFLAQQAWALWDGHYVWGKGPGAIEREWPGRVAVPGRPDASRSFGAHLHNTYLQWGVEFGAAAALFPMAILLWLMARFGRHPRDPWSLALLAMVMAFAFQAGTDVLTLHARGACLSLCWGLALASVGAAGLKSGPKRLEPR